MYIFLILALTVCKEIFLPKNKKGKQQHFFHLVFAKIAVRSIAMNSYQLFHKLYLFLTLQGTKDLL